MWGKVWPAMETSNDMTPSLTIGTFCVLGKVWIDFVDAISRV